jgi:predicted Fe-Mo cluster-binding NifX family protein
VIQSAKIAVYQCEGGSAAQAVDAYLAGDLNKLSEPSTSAHSG